MVGNRKILITQNLEGYLEKDRTYSRWEGFDLLIVNSGRQAWEIMENIRPHLIFLDLSMPDMQPDEFCRRVKGHAILGSIPVVIVINGHQDRDLENCLNAEYDEILFQPITNHLLLSTARKMLGISHRAFSRIPARLPVTIGLPPDRTMAGTSYNLSMGGIFVETLQPVGEEQILSLEFVLPQTKNQIRCEACVAWVNDPFQRRSPNLPPGMGLQFTSLGLRDLIAIRTHINTEATPLHV